jgi:hypothetical protein
VNRLRSFIFVAFFACQVASSQSSPKSGAKTSELAQGNWGGKHLALTVRPDGADFEFDCATGQIQEPIRLDRRGEFQAHGTYRIERPAHPAAEGSSSQSEPANDVLYKGKLRGKELRIAVMLPGRKSPSVFRVVLDAEPTLAKCM